MSVDPRRAKVAWAQVETPAVVFWTFTKSGAGKTGLVGVGASIHVDTVERTGFGIAGDVGGAYGDGSYGQGAYGEGAGRGLIGSGTSASVFVETGFGRVGTGHFLTMLEPIDTGRLADELGSERGRVGDTVAGVVLEDIEEVAA